MIAEVSLSKALICMAGQCFPILYGLNTPTGDFPLIQRYTDQVGYEGDVLQFKETENEILAVHRVWTLEKKTRMKVLVSSDNKQITKGCINVTPLVYDKLKNCCDKISITR